MSRTVALLVALAGALACRDQDRPPAGRAPAPAPGEPRAEEGGTGAMPGEPPAPPDGVRDVDGIVVRARSGTVVIQPADGETVVLALGPEAAVTLNGRVATAAEVREGRRVRAAYTLQDGDARLVRVDVERDGR